VAEKKQKEKKKGFINLLSSKKWIETVEKTVENRLKSARSSFDKKIQKAIKGLNITTKKDLNALNQKIKALEKRIEKLEGAAKITTPKSKTSETKETEGKEAR
jgi:polyhydroxyalkanoate synthesis regulator phasin